MAFHNREVLEYALKFLLEDLMKVLYLLHLYKSIILTLYEKSTYYYHFISSGSVYFNSQCGTGSP